MGAGHQRAFLRPELEAWGSGALRCPEGGHETCVGEKRHTPEGVHGADGGPDPLLAVVLS